MARTEQLASPRFLAGAAESIEVTVYQDGVPTDAAVAPAPACVVVDEAGVTVASGPATIAGGGSGRLTFALSAAQNAQPNSYTATWTATVGGTSTAVVTSHESVGELLFTLADARAWDGAAMGNATNYPANVVLRGRDYVQDSFERICRVAFGARYEREVLDGHGSAEMELRWQRVTRVRSVAERVAGSASWTAYTPAQLADILVYEDGRLYRETLGTFTHGRRNVAVEYEHGWQPIPEDVRRAALRVVRDTLVKSSLPDRALYQTTEMGQFRLAVAEESKGYWFGIPMVDAVLTRYRARIPGVR